MANRSEVLSFMAPGWVPLQPALGPPIMRPEMACVYSCPMTDMS